MTLHYLQNVFGDYIFLLKCDEKQQEMVFNLVYIFAHENGKTIIYSVVLIRL